MSGDPPAVEGEGSLGALAASASLAGAQGEEEAVSAQTQTAERADAAVQAGPPPPPPEAQRRAALAEPHLAAFLAAALPRCEEALQQNELADALADELAALADEEACEADAAAAGSRGTGAGHAASSGSTAGVVEHHSFSDLVHSRGCALAAVALHPTRRGVAAVACAHSPDQPSAATAGAGGGATAQMQQQPPLGCVLVWSHTDAMHPEAVLQAPADVLALAFHPTQPHWLAAGLVTGQVALFNLQQVPAAAAPGQGRHAGPAGTGEGAARLRTDSFAAGHDAAAAADGDARVAALLPLFLSSPDASHQAPVTDLHWLPGAAVSRDGRLQAAEAGGGLAPLASPRADVAPSSASGVSVPAADGSCNLFATVAADGGLLVWDMRISSRHARKLAAGAKDDEPLEWRPALALAAASAERHPLPTTRFCVDERGGAAPATAAAAGRFLVGSLEGELAAVDATSFSQERKGAVEWSHNSRPLVAGHTGRVLGLAFSPLLPDTLLVVGDCGFVIWRCGGAAATASAAEGDAGEGGSGSTAGAAAKEAALLPVFESPFPPALYTCGCWSPTKPGTVLLGRQDGRLEAWDLLDRMHQAAVVAPIAPCALTALAVAPAPAGGASGRASSAAQLLAVGDAAGTLRLLELPRALRRRGHAEIKAATSLLAREAELRAQAARRAEQRATEQRAAAAAAAQAAARKQQQASSAAAAKEEPTGGQSEEEAAAAAESRYLALEKEFSERLAAAEAQPAAAVAGCLKASSFV